MDLRNCELADVVKAVDADPSLALRLLKHDDEPDGVTMLWQACALGLDDVVLYLLSIPAEKLASAATAGDAAATTTHTSTAMNVNFQREKGQASCLYIAAQNGNAKCCEALLKHGALVDLPRDTGATPLFIATQRNSLPVVEVLVKSGAAVDAKNNQKCTPFVLACSMGHKEIAMKLLADGADFHNNETGSTCAQWAKKEGQTDMYATLLHMIFCMTIQGRVCLQLWMDYVDLKKKPFREIAALESKKRDTEDANEQKALFELHDQFAKERQEVLKLTGELPLAPFEELVRMPIDQMKAPTPATAVTSKPPAIIPHVDSVDAKQVESAHVTPKPSFRAATTTLSSSPHAVVVVPKNIGSEARAQPSSTHGEGSDPASVKAAGDSPHDILSQIQAEEDMGKKRNGFEGGSTHSIMRRKSGYGGDLGIKRVESSVPGGATRSHSFDSRHKEIEMRAAKEAIKRLEKEMGMPTSSHKGDLFGVNVGGGGLSRSTSKRATSRGPKTSRPSSIGKVPLTKQKKKVTPPQKLTVGGVGGVSNAEYFGSPGRGTSKNRSVEMTISSRFNANIPGRVNVDGETPGRRVEMLPSHSAMKLFASYPSKNLGIETKKKQNEEIANTYKGRDIGSMSPSRGGASPKKGGGAEILFAPSSTSLSPHRQSQHHTPHKSVMVDNLLNGMVPRSSQFDTSQTILADYSASSSYHSPLLNRTNHTSYSHHNGASPSSTAESIIARVEEYASEEIMEKNRIRDAINRLHADAPVSGNVNRHTSPRNRSTATGVSNAALDGSMNVADMSPHAVYLQSLAESNPLVNSPYNKIGPTLARNQYNNSSAVNLNKTSAVDVAIAAGVKVSKSAEEDARLAAYYGINPRTTNIVPPNGYPHNTRHAAPTPSSSFRSDPHSSNGTSFSFPYGISNTPRGGGGAPPANRYRGGVL